MGGTLRASARLPLRTPLVKELNMNKMAILALTAVSLMLAACNTVKGAGKDIESVGKEGEKVIQ